MSAPEPERWRRVEEVFGAVLDLPEEERTSFLDRTCAGDGTLRVEVDRLLKLHGQADTFLEPPTRSEPVGLLPTGNDRIGSCRIVRLLGEGGMGVVYEAWQETLRRPVAVKIMRAPFASAAARQRFDWEARILAHLRHPGIAQVYESGVHDPHGSGLGTPYFVLELIPGAEPLSDHVKRARLGRAAIVDLFLEVCAAVHFGHLRGVIHRDLKPGNLLVDEQGHPKVIDYGVARQVGEEAASRSFETQPGMIVGTLRYMSPEQLGGLPEEVDARVDVYALGVILYELLVGRHPYLETQLPFMETADLIRDRAPVRPSRIDPTLRGDLEAVLLKALAKEREGRYVSVAALADDLRAWREGRTVGARRPSHFHQAHLFARRHTAAVAGAAVAVAALIAAAILSTIFALRAERAREAEAARAEQAERLLKSSRRLGDWVINDLQNRLSTMPGATALREEVVRRVLEHLDALSKDARDNPQLLRSIARGYVHVSTLQGAPAYPNLGHGEEARRGFETALAIFRQIYGDDTAAPDRRFDFVLCGVMLADIDAVSGRLDAAERRYRELLPEIEQLERDGFHEADVTLVKAQACRGLAVIARQRGRTEDAVKFGRDAFDLRRAQAERNGADPAHARAAVGEGVALAYDLMGSGSGEEAEEVLREALAICEILEGGGEKESQPETGQVRLALSRLHLTSDRIGEAMTEGRRALRILEQALAADPENAGHALNLSVATAGLARACEQGGDPEEAFGLYLKDVDILRRLRAADAGNREIRQKLAIAVLSAGRLELQRDGAEAARAALDEALALTEALHAEEPAGEHDQHVLADTLLHSGLQREAAAREVEAGPERDRLLAEARALYERGRTHLRSWLEQAPAATWKTRRLGQFEERLKILAEGGPGGSGR